MMYDMMYERRYNKEKHTQAHTTHTRNAALRKGVPYPLSPTRVRAPPRAAPLPDELKTPKKGKQSPRVKLVVISKDELAKSVGTIQGLAPYLGAWVGRVSMSVTAASSWC